ncbi:MAG: TFIIB-type zinc ribbon-containing protein, partial [Candidatus Nitrosocaldaceae archaeon]
MCGKNKLIMDNSTGELFCANCGYVITERIEDKGREWKSFNKEEYENRSRTGIPNSLAMHDMGLATVIGTIDKDANGNQLPNAIRSTIERLRIWDSRSQMDEPLAKNLMQAMLELDRLKDKLAVSTSVIERTAYIYRKVLEKRLYKGSSISSFVAAALYAACRESETPRTLKDIADASNTKR